MSEVVRLAARFIYAEEGYQMCYETRAGCECGCDAACDPDAYDRFGSAVDALGEFAATHGFEMDITAFFDHGVALDYHSVMGLTDE